MFTLEQIKAAHSKVKSGIDFPRYIHEIKQLGVMRYETFVADGHTDYMGLDAYKMSSDAKYTTLIIANNTNALQFKADLKAHQEGKTDYPTFCQDCAKSGIEKWAVQMDDMTCTYYSQSGEVVLVETIPG
jgi:uncharacterized protein YbcV (DUF1398 family)